MSSWPTILLVGWLVAASAALAGEAARVRWIIRPELAPNVEAADSPPIRGRLQVKALAAPWGTIEVELEGVAPVELELPAGTWWRLEAAVAGGVFELAAVPLGIVLDPWAEAFESA